MVSHSNHITTAFPPQIPLDYICYFFRLLFIIIPIKSFSEEAKYLPIRRLLAPLNKIALTFSPQFLKIPKILKLRVLQFNSWNSEAKYQPRHKWILQRRDFKKKKITGNFKMYFFYSFSQKKLMTLKDWRI